MKAIASRLGGPIAAAACVSLVVTAALAPSADAQAPPRVRLVKDLNPGPEPSGFGRFAVLGSRTLFAAYDPVHGEELWITDGTTEGTILVKDIHPTGDGVPTDLRLGPVVLGDIALFAAETPESGREIWRTDGTEAGTTLVEDIAPGALSGIRFGGTAVRDGILYFFARTPSEPFQLWRSDGTGVGTYALSVPGGVANDGLCRWCRVVAHGGRVLFASDLNRFLWSTDGTAAGTTLVKAFDQSTPLELFYDASDLVSVGSYVFFPAPGSSALGWELWRTDGTASGTVMVTDLNPGSQSSRPVDLRPAGPDGLTYIATDGVHGFERWLTDGAGLRTRMLGDIGPGPESSAYDYGWTMSQVVAGGRLVFSAITDGVHGNELWARDGSSRAVRLLKDVLPGTGSGLVEAEQGVLFGGNLYLSGDDGVHGRELWRTDGTPAGTFMVEDTLDGGISSSATPLIRNGSTLLLGAWHWETGWELYAYDLPAATALAPNGPKR